MVGLGRIRRIILIKKLEMLGFLLEDADNEAKKINEFKDALESGDEKRLWNAERPNRQRIKDDLKMMRRLSIEVEKEAEKLW
jgi:hypothetical protein